MMTQQRLRPQVLTFKTLICKGVVFKNMVEGMTV